MSAAHDPYASHYENFPVASCLLPSSLRAPVMALYRFARSADDIADEGVLPADERLRRLNDYAQALDQISSKQGVDMASDGVSDRTLDAIFQPLSLAIKAHDLPLALLHDLLDAFRQDVVQTRYESYVELLDYCRRSANPVGRLMLRLFRAENPQQLHCSDAICSSLQLINHWQDVAIDKNKQPNRIYLPQEDLRRFAVSEDQIMAEVVNTQWHDLMRFQVDRARALMLEGAPLCRTLSGRIGLELRMIVAGGLRILDKIEAVNYDVFRHRPTLKAYDFPLMLWRATRLAL